MREFLLLTTFAFAISAGSIAKAEIIISLDQTGANLGLNINEPRIWNFSVSQNITVDLARFAMKNGGSTVEAAVFELYNNLGGTGTVIATSTLGPANFSKSSYVPEDFSFTSTLLTPGDYSATLSSNAPASPNNQTYFMKAGRIVLLQADGVTELGSDFYTPDTNTDGTATTAPLVAADTSAVPEPSTAFGLSILLFVTAFRRKKRSLG